MQCVPTAAADKTWRKWGLDRVPVVVKLCSFLSGFHRFIHSLLLPFFYACERHSVQEAFHAVFYSICERECHTHTHTHTHTQHRGICVLYPLQSEASDIFDYSRAEIGVYRGIRTRLSSDFSAFIFLRNCVISADNLPLRQWTAHQPLTVCSAPTIIYSFEKNNGFRI